MKPLVILCLAAGSAAAQSTSWHATVNGDVAVTDNVFAAPFDGNRAGDLLFQLRPGGLFTYSGQRMVHDLTADLELLHYAFNSRRPTLTSRGGWRVLLVTGPRSELQLSLGGGTGVLTNVSSRLTADETLINITPVGRVTYASASAGQSFTYTITRQLRFGQRLFARANSSDDNAMFRTEATGAEAGGGLALSRDWRNHTVSLDAGASVSRLERVAEPGARLDSRLDRQVLPRVRGVWRYDVARRVGIAADAGVVGILPFGTDPYNPMQERERAWFPVAGGTLEVNELWGRAAMSLRRDVAPNFLFAQNAISDNAIISAAVPLPWLDNTRRRNPKLIGVGTVAIQRSRMIDAVTGNLSRSLGAARVDLAAIYTPRANVSYGLRYELIFQMGDEGLGAVVPVQGFFRNTIFFTFNMRFPERVAGELPKRRAGAAANESRSDMTPVGAEPVVPDLLESESEDGDER